MLTYVRDVKVTEYYYSIYLNTLDFMDLIAVTLEHYSLSSIRIVIHE